MAVAIPELDAGIPFLLHKRWFPLVMTSPATMYVTLLTAASHYCIVNSVLQSSPAVASILLDLKQACLESINREIRALPPNSPLPDTVVGAVAKMASYEAMFGTGLAYHTHMRGLTSIIAQRGGLGRLGLGGLLMRMVLWIDINSAFILGGQTYFEAAVPLAGHIGFMRPNPMHFLSVFGRGETVSSTAVAAEEVSGPTTAAAAAAMSVGAGLTASVSTIEARERQYRDWLALNGNVSAAFEEDEDPEVRRGNVWTACGGNLKVPRRGSEESGAGASVESATVAKATPTTTTSTTVAVAPPAAPPAMGPYGPEPTFAQAEPAMSAPTAVAAAPSSYIAAPVPAPLAYATHNPELMMDPLSASMHPDHHHHQQQQQQQQQQSYSLPLLQQQQQQQQESYLPQQQQQHPYFDPTITPPYAAVAAAAPDASAPMPTFMPPAGGPLVAYSSGQEGNLYHSSAYEGSQQ